MSNVIFLGLATITLAMTHNFADCIYRTYSQSSLEKEGVKVSQEQQDDFNLLKRREKERQRYTVEQKTIHDFSCEKKVDYTPYFADYIFAVEVDRTQDKIFVISKSGKLDFDQHEIEEIKRRVLFMDAFEENMDKYYLASSESQDSFNPHMFGWPEYKNVPYSPFSSVNNTDTHIYGFVNKPKALRLISGTNFLEDSPYGKQTNPQAVFIDYEFGPMRNGTLEERNNARFKFLNDEFKKNRADPATSDYAKKIHYIDEACRIVGKTKNQVRILDIGCGLGIMLNILRVEGYQNLYGIDMDSNKVGVLQRVCRENRVREIMAAPLNMNSEKVVEKICQNLKQDAFDVILLHDAIEHIPDPPKTLHIIHSLLAKKGVVFFTGIPDENSLAAQFESSTYGDYNKFTHLNFFTKESIAALAHEEGFDVEFLHEEDANSNLRWSFIYDECLPYVMNGKWIVLGKSLPDGMKIRDVFSDCALVYNIFSFRPQDGQRMRVNFERYKLYEKHKDYINLLFKKFFMETTAKIVSPDLLKTKLKDLKENLFNTLILDSPTGISVDDRERLADTKDTDATRVGEAFQEAYQLSLRTRWCYFFEHPSSVS